MQYSSYSVVQHDSSLILATWQAQCNAAQIKGMIKEVVLPTGPACEIIDGGGGPWREASDVAEACTEGTTSQARVFKTHDSLLAVLLPAHSGPGRST